MIESSSSSLVLGRNSLRLVHGVRRAGVALLVAGMAWSCTQYEPASDTLPTDEVNSLTPSESSGIWGCLDPVTQSAPRPVVSDEVGRVVYSVQIVDLSTGKIYPDARVRACGIADINCENPVTNTIQVNAEGWVDLPVFRNFSGFLEVSTAEAVPMLFYLTEPVEQSTVEFPIGVISIASLGPLVQLLGVQPQANTGVVAFRAFDCDGNPASGVSLSTNTAGLPWYFVDRLPSSMATSTGADGLTGLVNVDPGLAVLDLKAPNGASIGGSQSVVVRPNWMSAAFVRPPSTRRTTPE